MQKNSEASLAEAKASEQREAEAEAAWAKAAEVRAAEAKAAEAKAVNLLDDFQTRLAEAKAAEQMAAEAKGAEAKAAEASAAEARTPEVNGLANGEVNLKDRARMMRRRQMIDEHEASSADLPPKDERTGNRHNTEPIPENKDSLPPDTVLKDRARQGVLQALLDQSLQALIARVVKLDEMEMLYELDAATV